MDDLRRPLLGIAVVTGVLFALSLLASWLLVAAGVSLQESVAGESSWVALSFLTGLSLATTVYWPWRQRDWYPAWWGRFLLAGAIVIVVGVPLVWVLRIPYPLSNQLTAYVASSLLTLPIFTAAALGVRHEARAGGVQRRE